MSIPYLAFCALIVCAHGYRSSSHGISHSPLTSVYDWKVLEFGFPNYYTKYEAKINGNLEPTNAVPIDVQPTNSKLGRRIFVTIPKLATGIPYTLATVSEKRTANGPLLEPYPNYEAHDNKNGTNCNAITSAFRVAVNECNQMWVIDNGMIDTYSQCPPQLLLIDLETDQLIHRYRFDLSLYTPHSSLFITPVLNVLDPAPKGTCRHTMVYVADEKRHGLVVYDFLHNNAWRIENSYMYPNPDNGVTSVDGVSFAVMDGIFGMATDKHNLYFHALSSTSEYAVPLSVINNSTLFKDNSNNMYEQFRSLGKRPSPCTVSAMDSHNNLYCVTLDPISLLVWHVHKPYYTKKVITSPAISKHLQFVSGMKVVKNRYGKEELWMFAIRFQKIITGTQDHAETNFEILTMPLPDVGVKNIYFRKGY